MVYILLADGFEDMEAVCPYDILNRGGVEVKFVGITGEVVRASNGVRLLADVMPETVTPTSEDTVVVPGGMGGVQAIEASGNASSLLKRADAAGAALCAICAGPRALGKLGLIGARSYTCYPGIEQEIAAGRYQNASVVRDGNLITARAPGSAMDFGLALLEQIRGKETAERVRGDMLYDGDI